MSTSVPAPPTPPPAPPPAPPPVAPPTTPPVVVDVAAAAAAKGRRNGVFRRWKKAVRKIIENRMREGEFTTKDRWKLVYHSLLTKLNIKTATDEPSSVGREGPKSPLPSNVSVWRDLRGRSLPAVAPNSVWRRYWNFVICLVVLWNAFSVPFLMVFRPRFLALWYMIDYACDILLSADVFFYFFVGYFEDGMLVMNKESIKKHYFKTKFSVDAMSMMPLDTLFLFKPKIRAYLRLFRLLRLLRLPEKLRSWEGYLSHPQMARLAKLVLGIFLITHITGCLYFELVSGQNTEQVKLLTKDGLSVTYARVTFHAFTLLIGQGGIKRMPEAPLLFTACTVCVGVFVFAFVIGNVNNVIASLNADSDAFQTRMDMVNDFMIEHNMSTDLQVKVRSYYLDLRERVQGWENYTTDENAVLKLFPPHLRTEASMVLHSALLKKVSIFANIKEDGFFHILARSLRPQMYSPQDDIIRHGEVGTDMFFISRGVVEVILADGKKVGEMSEGNVFGEIAVLFRGKRTATIRAKTYVDAYVLNKETVDVALEDYPECVETIYSVAELRLKFSDISERKKFRNQRAAHLNRAGLLDLSAETHFIPSTGVQLPPQPEPDTAAGSAAVSRPGSRPTSPRPPSVVPPTPTAPDGTLAVPTPGTPSSNVFRNAATAARAVVKMTPANTTAARPPPTSPRPPGPAPPVVGQTSVQAQLTRALQRRKNLQGSNEQLHEEEDPALNTSNNMRRTQSIGLSRTNWAQLAQAVANASSPSPQPEESPQPAPLTYYYSAPAVAAALVTEATQTSPRGHGLNDNPAWAELKGNPTEQYIRAMEQVGALQPLGPLEPVGMDKLHNAHGILLDALRKVGDAMRLQSTLPNGDGPWSNTNGHVQPPLTTKELRAHDRDHPRARQRQQRQQASDSDSDSSPTSSPGRVKNFRKGSDASVVLARPHPIGRSNRSNDDSSDNGVSPSTVESSQRSRTAGHHLRMALASQSIPEREEPDSPVARSNGKEQPASVLRSGLHPLQLPSGKHVGFSGATPVNSDSQLFDLSADKNVLRLDPADYPLSRSNSDLLTAERRQAALRAHLAGVAASDARQKPLADSPNAAPAGAVEYSSPVPKLDLAGRSRVPTSPQAQEASAGGGAKASTASPWSPFIPRNEFAQSATRSEASNGRSHGYDERVVPVLNYAEERQREQRLQHELYEVERMRARTERELLATRERERQREIDAIRARHQRTLASPSWPSGSPPSEHRSVTFGYGGKPSPERSPEVASGHGGADPRDSAFQKVPDDDPQTAAGHQRTGPAATQSPVKKEERLERRLFTDSRSTR